MQERFDSIVDSTFTSISYHTLTHYGVFYYTAYGPIVIVCRNAATDSLIAFINSDYLRHNPNHIKYIKHAIYKLGVKRGKYIVKSSSELLLMFSRQLNLSLEDLSPDKQVELSTDFILKERVLIKGDPVEAIKTINNRLVEAKVRFPQNARILDTYGNKWSVVDHSQFKLDSAGNILNGGYGTLYRAVSDQWATILDSSRSKTCDYYVEPNKRKYTDEELISIARSKYIEGQEFYSEEDLVTWTIESPDEWEILENGSLSNAGYGILYSSVTDKWAEIITYEEEPEEIDEEAEESIDNSEEESSLELTLESEMRSIIQNPPF